MIGIYLIRNIITNKVYVGQSTNIQRRWWEHKSRAFDPNNNCYNKPLYCSMRKYGLDAFKLEILCECSIEELNQLEADYITKFNCLVPFGYNILANSDRKNIPNPKYICKNCGKLLNWPNDSNLCRTCYTVSTRKVDRPSKEELYNIIKEHQGNFSEVGRMFGITDNAVRKWCKGYGIPSHSKDYKQMRH